MKQPAVEATQAIIEVMRVGSTKDGCNEDWRDKPLSYHVLKAIRHATTAHMIYLGIVRDDGEDHLKLAITRLAMALCKEKV